MKLIAISPASANSLRCRQLSQPRSSPPSWKSVVLHRKALGDVA
jgi:hypothetical protein